MTNSYHSNLFGLFLRRHPQLSVVSRLIRKLTVEHTKMLLSTFDELVSSTLDVTNQTERHTIKRKHQNYLIVTEYISRYKLSLEKKDSGARTQIFTSNQESPKVS